MSNEDALLVQAYREQKLHYDEATRLTESIRQQFEQSGFPDAELHQLNQVMMQIARADEQIASLRALAAPALGNGELRQVTDELKTIIEHLLGQINVVEQYARSSRQKLAPQVSTSVKQRRMLSAYRQV